MNRLRHSGIILTVIVALALILPQTVQASTDAGAFGQGAHVHYLDPGTGSLIIQMIIGSLVASLAMIGVYRRRVNSYLRSLFKTRRGDEDSE